MSQEFSKMNDNVLTRHETHTNNHEHQTKIFPALSKFQQIKPNELSIGFTWSKKFAIYFKKRCRDKNQFSTIYENAKSMETITVFRKIINLLGIPFCSIH